MDYDQQNQPNSYDNLAPNEELYLPDQPTPQPTLARKTARGAWDFVKFIVSVVLMVIFITTFVFQSYEVFGSSMEPTLDPSDKLLISKVKRSFARIGDDNYLPKRGDIVVFNDPRGSDLRLIKRVVGFPGERVLVQDGIITVFNGQNPNGLNPDDNVEEDLLYTNGFDDTVVPEGQIYVVGDNRSGGGSADSRNDVGTVPISNIVGELVLRIYPLTDAKFF